MLRLTGVYLGLAAVLGWYASLLWWPPIAPQTGLQIQDDGPVFFAASLLFVGTATAASVVLWRKSKRALLVFLAWAVSLGLLWLAQLGFNPLSRDRAGDFLIGVTCVGTLGLVGLVPVLLARKRASEGK